MSTTQKTVDFICAQSGLAQRITARKMFGEFALYVDGKVVALVCDDTLFVKPTPVVAKWLGAVDLQPPYSGAKPHFCITEQLDDRELLQRILLLTGEGEGEGKGTSEIESIDRDRRTKVRHWRGYATGHEEHQEDRCKKGHQVPREGSTCEAVRGASPEAMMA
jgi:TfoX/Sxy family transcriptional regulator of competence genes